MAVGLERPHAEFASQGEGLLVVSFGLRGIRGVGVGVDSAKLVQRARLGPAFFMLPSQVERLMGVLPALLPASCQTADLTKPCDPVGKTSHPARADTFPDRLLQEPASLREAPLERISSAQAGRDPWPRVPVVGGTTEGQAMLQHPDGLLQVPLGEVQAAEGAMGNARYEPSGVQRSATERLLPVAPALGEGPKRA